jgi:hypothetical protein
MSDVDVVRRFIDAESLHFDCATLLTTLTQVVNLLEFDPLKTQECPTTPSSRLSQALVSPFLSS